MKHTKIVCTIGPASASTTPIEQMIRAGMNVARLNFSHGTYADHEKFIANIRSAANAVGVPVALLQDLQGPRIRLGKLDVPEILLKKKARVVLVTQTDYESSEHKDVIALPIQYHRLHHYVSKNNRILIKDGTIELNVERVVQGNIYCTVVQGGIVGSHQGLNIPGAPLGAEAITAKDKRDIEFGIRHQVDFVALSFVREAADIRQLRRLLSRPQLKTKAKNNIGIIAKIERQEAIDNLEEIIEAADGIMVARGDLGVELGSAAVPLLQKEMITKCIAAGKPVIVATQMLESMTKQPRPTRAEASDVANAVIDHADALMLSGESANGQFPIQSVQTMTSIIKKVEASRYDNYDATQQQQGSVHGRIARAAIELAQMHKAKVLVLSAQNLSEVVEYARQRPEGIKLIVCVSSDHLVRQCTLVWGVTAMRLSLPKKLSVATAKVKAALIKHKIVKKGNTVILVSQSSVTSKSTQAKAQSQSIESITI